MKSLLHTSDCTAVFSILTIFDNILWHSDLVNSSAVLLRSFHVSLLFYSFHVFFSLLWYMDWFDVYNRVRTGMLGCLVMYCDSLAFCFYFLLPRNTSADYWIFELRNWAVNEIVWNFVKVLKNLNCNNVLIYLVNDQLMTELKLNITITCSLNNFFRLYHFRKHLKRRVKECL